MANNPMDAFLEKLRKGSDYGGTVLQPLTYEIGEQEPFNKDEVLKLPEPAGKAVSIQNRLGYAVMEALPELIGHRWDDVAMAAVQTLRPSAIRVATRGVKFPSDSVWWRVTVYLENALVTRVCQEVKVMLPTSVRNGREFKAAMSFKEVKPGEPK